MNIRSLRHKNNDLHDFIDQSIPKFHIIAITESWLNNNEARQFQTNNYNFYSQSRNTKKGGGVGLFVKRNMNVKLRNDLNLQNNIEALIIEILGGPDSKNKLIMVVYRPPTCSIQYFCDSIEEILIQMSQENKSIIVVGDFNIEMFADTTETHRNYFLQLMNSFGLYGAITIPTRITSAKQSLIDNIFISCDRQISGTISCDLSDHLPIFIDIWSDKQNESNPNVLEFPLKKYSFSTVRINKLNMKLCFADWNEVFACQNVNQSWEKFIDNYSIYFEECCQINNKKKILKMQKQKPWMNGEIKKYLKKKNNCFKKFIKNPTKENEDRFKTSNKTFKKMKAKAKKQYLFQELKKMSMT